MSAIKVIAGDFPSGDYIYSEWEAAIEGIATPTRVDLAGNIEKIEKLTEEQSTRLGRAAGLGVAGALVAGPVGAIVGGLLGGKRTQVCFLIEMKDGKTLTATSAPEIYAKIFSAKNKMKADIKLKEPSAQPKDEGTGGGTAPAWLATLFVTLLIALILFAMSKGNW